MQYQLFWWMELKKMEEIMVKNLWHFEDIKNRPFLDICPLHLYFLEFAYEILICCAVWWVTLFSEIRIQFDVLFSGLQSNMCVIRFLAPKIYLLSQKVDKAENLLDKGLI